MKYGVCNWILPMSMEESFDFAKKIGLDGVSIEYSWDNGEMLLANPDLQERILKKMQETGLEIPALGVNALCDCGMPKPENYEKVCEMFDTCIAIAIKLGISVLQVPSFFDGFIQNEEDLVQTMKCLKYAIGKVEEAGLQLGYENALTIEQNLRVIKELDSKSYFVYFDTQNPARELGVGSAEKLAEALYPYIKQLHVKDSYEDVQKPLQLGEGTTNFNETLQIFKDHNYSGWVVMESEYKAYSEYETILKKDLANMKDAFEVK